MMVKTCKICDKPINESEKWRRRTCRKCHNEIRKKYDKRYYESHKKEIEEYHKEYRKSHREEIKKYKKEYYESHKKEIKEYYESHREELKEYRKEYYESHREECKEYSKEYRKSHKEECKEYRKEYYNQSKSNYVYVIVYDNKVSYVGSTTNINNRINYHINGHSNVNEKWNYIYYLDTTNMLTDEITLQLLEQLLFDHFKPEFNIRNPVDKTNIPIPKQKMDLVLQQLLNSKEWRMYNKVHEVLKAIGGDKSI